METKETSNNPVATTLKETKSKKKDKASEELDIFVAGDYKLANGETIERPKLSWGKQIILLRQFSKLLSTVPELKEVNFEAFTIKDLVQVLPNILEHAPEAFTEMCAVILNKDEEFVNDKMDMDDILGLIVPFLRGLFSRIGKTFGRAEEAPPQQ